MSIVALVGFPGCGKSYSAVEQHLLPALRAHRVVVTNLPLHLDRLKRDFPGCDVREFPTAAVAAQPELILDAVPPGAILILDEVMKLFPAGIKANDVPEAYRLMFAEHRHRVDAAGQSTQIVLMCQDLSQIGTFIRKLVEQTFRMTKLTTLGIPSSSRFRCDIYPGPQAGPNPPAGLRLRQMLLRYRREVYQYYISHTQSESDTDVGADEDKMDKRANIFRKPFLVSLPFIALGVLALLWFKGGYLLDKYHKKPAASAPASAGGVTPATPPAAHSSFFGAALAKVEGAGDWKVVGTLRNADHAEKSFAILRSDSLKQTVSVKLSKCIVVEDEPTRCAFEGFMYAADGKSAVPVSGPLGIAPPLRVDSPVLPPTLSEAKPLDPYTDEALVEDPVSHVVEFRRARVSRGGLSVSSVR